MEAALRFAGDAQSVDRCCGVVVDTCAAQQALEYDFDCWRVAFLVGAHVVLVFRRHEFSYALAFGCELNMDWRIAGLYFTIERLYDLAAWCILAHRIVPSHEVLALGIDVLASEPCRRGCVAKVGHLHVDKWESRARGQGVAVTGRAIHCIGDTRHDIGEHPVRPSCRQYHGTRRKNAVLSAFIDAVGADGVAAVGQQAGDHHVFDQPDATLPSLAAEHSDEVDAIALVVESQSVRYGMPGTTVDIVRAVGLLDKADPERFQPLGLLPGLGDGATDQIKIVEIATAVQDILGQDRFGVCRVLD